MINLLFRTNTVECTLLPLLWIIAFVIRRLLFKSVHRMHFVAAIGNHRLLFKSTQRMSFVAAFVNH